jgi:hypothetical protein
MYYTHTMLEPQPPRAAGLVTVQLGPELKTEWVQWCAARDLVPGKALRNLVEKALREGLELAVSVKGERVKVLVAKAPDVGPKVGREVQFTPSENSAIEAVAVAQGLGFQEWVIAAVRAALAKVPTYGQAELEALTESNLRLAQLVIELGALRRSKTVGAAAEDLERLEREVKAHVELVSVAMAKGAQRWQLKV